MKKVNIILIIMNIIMCLLICLKITRQQEIIKYEISDANITPEDIEYDLTREFVFGEKEYAESINGVRINNSEELRKDIELEDGLKVKEFFIKYSNLSTYIDAVVENTTAEVQGDYSAYLVLYNDKENEIIRLPVYINKVLPGEEVKLSTSILTDVSGVFKIEIEKMEEEVLDEEE